MKLSLNKLKTIIRRLIIENDHSQTSENDKKEEEDLSKCLELSNIMIHDVSKWKLQFYNCLDDEEKQKFYTLITNVYIKFKHAFSRLGNEKIFEKFNNKILSDKLKINLRNFDDNFDRYHTNALAYYDVDSNELTVFSKNFSKSNHSHEKDLIYIIIHELSHYIEFSYLHGAAQKFWHEPWDKYEKEKSNIQNSRDNYQNVTLEKRKELEEIYNKIIELNKKKSNDEIKEILDSLSESDQFIMSAIYDQYKLLLNHGDELDSHISIAYLDLDFEPETWPFKRNEEIKKAIQQQIDDMFFTKTELKDNPLFITNSYYRKNILNDKLSKLETRFFMDLNLPTAYAQKNKHEDFAESLTYFILHPEKLSQQATYRIKKTISLMNIFSGTELTAMFERKKYFKNREK
jgi:hypothetical protein